VLAVITVLSRSASAAQVRGLLLDLGALRGLGQLGVAGKVASTCSGHHSDGVVVAVAKDPDVSAFQDFESVVFEVAVEAIDLF
jgi:hypothetical protein